MILILSNLPLGSEIICQIFSLWWDFKEVCASCYKSARSYCLVLKLLKFSLYLVLNEKFHYGDLEASGYLLYSVLWPSTHSKEHLRKIMSNTVILKLRGVYRTQSCDPLCGLEIIWWLKMSKLLNLIAYSLAVYSQIQTELLVAYVSIWQNTCLKLLLLILSWYLSCLYMLVLFEIEVFMLVITLLKLLYRLISYLPPCYMFVIF
jgi:hypothetical protein